jgi:HSP20 family protein
MYCGSMEGSNMRPFLPDPPAPDSWFPKTDVYISEDGRLTFEMELAAIKKEDLELTVEAKRLIIRGERSDGGRRQRCRYLVKELQYGPFENIIEIPSDYDYDLTQARVAYRDGILQIDVPPKPPPS